MEIIGIVALIFIALLVFGALGWIFKGISFIFEKMLEGFDGCFGCFAYFLIGCVVLGFLAGLFGYF